MVSANKTYKNIICQRLPLQIFKTLKNNNNWNYCSRSASHCVLKSRVILAVKSEIISRITVAVGMYLEIAFGMAV